MTTKIKRNWMVLFLFFYLLLTLYFLFFGFGRLNLSRSMNYNLLLEPIPLAFPNGSTIFIWVFNMGNFLAFIPFGVMIPLLFRSTYIKFILLFVLSITVVELIQLFSGLGAFDINDIIINTLGASIGYLSQRIIPKHRELTSKGIIIIIISASITSILTISIVSIFNYYLEKEGPYIDLSEVSNLNTNLKLEDKDFKDDRKKLNTRKNYLFTENTATIENIDRHYAELRGSATLAKIDTLPERIDISFIANEEEIYSISFISDDYQKEDTTFQLPIAGISELEIRVTDETEESISSAIMLEDIELSEMNMGQKIMYELNKRITSILN
ncbi:VanZ family protein [Alkalicoccobacillus gibsonii]|uniref:VanZ family protein n=1 Tax=Alkalicoccobacillus gibsonii TaxID=79881 RepID=A0ABU9VD50_9BACI